MNPLGTRARAEELAALLDGAVAGPGSLTAAGASIATRLRTLAPALDAGPRPEFRAALRQRLVAVATVQASATALPAPAQPAARPRVAEAALSWSRTRAAQRRIGVTAGAMASVVALTGVGVAATRSLPGQPFYAVKRATEGLQLDLAGNDTDRGTKHLEFAATRLREVRALAHHDDALSLGSGTPSAAGAALSGATAERIADTLADFNRETRAGNALLTQVFRKTGKPAPLRILTTFSEQQRSRLSALLPSLPAAAEPQARTALALVAQVGSDATDLLALGTCGGSCYPGNGGPQLPAQPVPTPGATATPGSGSGTSSSSGGDNGVAGCTCGQPSATPEPTTAPAPATTASPTPEPTAEPTAAPTPEPTSSPSPSPSPAPSDSPLLPLPPLPVPVPTPTLPVPLPTLPAPLGGLVPTLPVPPKG